MNTPTFPRESIETLFLDAGNTLIHMNHELVLEGLAEVGLTPELEALREAEARARVPLSEFVGGERSTEGTDTRLFWIEKTLLELDRSIDPSEYTAGITAWVERPSVWERLWSWVPEFVPRALDRLRDKGYRLVVVSNSDGSVADQLARADLADRVDAIIDSAIVGVEKPDPRIFDFAFEHTESAREACLHVGDIYHIDIVGARRAGVHAALIDPYDAWGHADAPRFRNIEALEEQLPARG